MEQQHSQSVQKNEVVENGQENPPISPESQSSIEQNKSNPQPIQQEDSPEALYEIKQHFSNEQIVDNPIQIPIKSIQSEPSIQIREQKAKKRKVRAYVQDFTDYLPQSLIIVNKTVIPAMTRIGDRHQVNIPSSPPLKSLYRPMEQWMIWRGSSNPELRPSQQQLLRFKQLLGENRTQQQFIQIKERLGSNSWREVLQVVGRSKGELRRIFHTAQRNRN